MGTIILSINIINLSLNADGTYKNGIDFFELYSLQQIDLCMKNAIFYPLLQIEQHLKICIAYEYASTYGPFDGENMSNYVEPYFKKENYNIYLKTFDKRPKYELLIEHLKKYMQMMVISHLLIIKKSSSYPHLGPY